MEGPEAITAAATATQKVQYHHTDEEVANMTGVCTKEVEFFPIDGEYHGVQHLEELSNEGNFNLGSIGLNSDSVPPTTVSFDGDEAAKQAQIEVAEQVQGQAHTNNSLSVDSTLDSGAVLANPEQPYIKEETTEWDPQNHQDYDSNDILSSEEASFLRDFGEPSQLRDWAEEYQTPPPRTPVRVISSDDSSTTRALTSSPESPNSSCFSPCTPGRFNKTTVNKDINASIIDQITAECNAIYQVSVDQAAIAQATHDQAVLDQAAICQAAIDQAAIDQVAIDQAAIDNYLAKSAFGGWAGPDLDPTTIGQRSISRAIVDKSAINKGTSPKKPLDKNSNGNSSDSFAGNSGTRRYEDDEPPVPFTASSSDNNTSKGKPAQEKVQCGLASIGSLTLPVPHTAGYSTPSGSHKSALQGTASIGSLSLPVPGYYEAVPVDTHHPIIEKEPQTLIGSKSSEVENPYRRIQEQSQQYQIANGLFHPPQRSIVPEAASHVAATNIVPQNTPSVRAQVPKPAPEHLKGGGIDFRNIEPRDITGMSLEGVVAAYKELVQESTRARKTWMQWMQTARHCLSLQGPPPDKKIWTCNNYVDGKKCPARNMEWVSNWTRREHCEACHAAKPNSEGTGSPSNTEYSQTRCGNSALPTTKKRQYSAISSSRAGVISSTTENGSFQATGSFDSSAPTSKRPRLQVLNSTLSMHSQVPVQGTLQQNLAQHPIMGSPSQASRDHTMGHSPNAPSTLSQGAPHIGAFVQRPMSLSPAAIKRAMAMGLAPNGDAAAAFTYRGQPMRQSMTASSRGEMPQHTGHPADFAALPHAQLPQQNQMQRQDQLHQQAHRQQRAQMQLQAQMQQQSQMRHHAKLQYQAELQYQAQIQHQAQMQHQAQIQHQAQVMNSTVMSRPMTQHHGGFQLNTGLFSKSATQEYMPSQSACNQQSQQGRLAAAMAMAQPNGPYKSPYFAQNEVRGHPIPVAQHFDPIEGVQIDLTQSDKVGSPAFSY